MDEAEVARGLRERLSLDLALAAAQTEELRQDKQALQAQLASLNNCTGSSVLTGLTSRLEPTPVLQDEQRRVGSFIIACQDAGSCLRLRFGK